MKTKWARPAIWNTLLGVFFMAANQTCLQGQSSNAPPEVSILWPRRDCAYDDYVFLPGEIIKIKASAADPDGSITQVQFYANTNLIGVASNAPYSVIWKAGPGSSSAYLKAVATDNLGASTESSSVWVGVLGGSQMPPVFEIISPINGIVFAAPGAFEFTAELLASPNGDTGSLQFFVGANSAGIVTQTGPFTNTTPLFSVTVTNLPEGEYNLWLRKDNFATAYFASGSCDPPVILVTKLGLVSSRLTPDGSSAFDVVTSFPTNQNIIEASSNLLNWTSISTNVPFANTFLFTDPSPATDSPRFYRAVVPSK